MNVEVKLYEYAIILAERRDRDGEVVEKARLIEGPKAILAKNDAQAQLIAGQAIQPEDIENNLDRLAVVVRPF